VSGKFCLPFSPDEEARGNYHSKLVRNKPAIFDEPYNCPHISFVPGIIDVAGDSSKVLVSYGLNDCTARIVEIDKSEIIRLLFPDQ